MFGVYSLLGNGHSYSALTDDYNTEKQKSPSPSSLRTRLVRCLVVLLALFGVGGLGFFAGQRSIPSVKEKEDFHCQYIPAQRGLSITWDATVGTVSRILEYNETFTGSSTASNAAWKTLIPHRGGFFNHPTLAPQRSVFSIFHQLHCLNGMRQGYWALHSAMNEGTVLKEHDMPEMSSPKHFMHCTDLIRQVLMCQPDLTLEKKIEAVGGVAGFGTEHVCKNWEDLISFVEDWQDWGRN